MDHGAALDPDDPELAEALTRENPIGRLWEMCQRLHIRRPVLSSEHRDGGDWVLALRVRFGERTYDSGPCRARSRVLAKHLAAKLLMDAIDSEPKVASPLTSATPSPLPPPPDTEPELSDLPEAPPSSRDPRMILNEIQHAEWITTWGYEHLGGHGPPHARTFIVRAWCVLDGGERVQSEPVHARSKRSGEAIAAAHLLGRVREARDREAARIIEDAMAASKPSRT
jgi:dsRNA-specific ribonuclease